MPSLHPTALVAPEAELAPDVEVGPFAVIDGPARLAAGVRVGGHAWLHGRVVVAERTAIGWGAVLGADPQDLGFDPATDSRVEIGPQNTIREYATIHRGSQPGSATRTGARNLIMVGAHLAHDCVVGDDCVLANNVLVAGHVSIGNRVFLGGGSGFHQFIRIGDLAITQGNAAISQDVPPYSVAHGYNRLAGLNVIGMRRAGIDAATRAEIKRLHRLLFGAGMALSAALAEAQRHDWSPAAQVLLDAAARPSRKGILSMD